MFCRQCGVNIGEGARFCPSCGAPQGEMPVQPQVSKAVRWETISLQVGPNDEQETIDNHEAFGWEFVSSQNVYAKDSHLEKEYGLGDYEALYSVTETTNYIKLVFRRNKNMNNYAQIVMLEREYSSLFEHYKSGAWVPAGEPYVPFNIVGDVIPDEWAEKVNAITSLVALPLAGLQQKRFKKYLEKKNSKKDAAMEVWQKWKDEEYDPAEKAITTQLAVLKRKANALLSSN